MRGELETSVSPESPDSGINLFLEKTDVEVQHKRKAPCGAFRVVAV